MQLVQNYLPPSTPCNQVDSSFEQPVSEAAVGTEQDMDSQLPRHPVITNEHRDDDEMTIKPTPRPVAMLQQQGMNLCSRLSESLRPRQSSQLTLIQIKMTPRELSQVTSSS